MKQGDARREHNNTPTPLVNQRIADPSLRPVRHTVPKKTVETVAHTLRHTTQQGLNDADPTTMPELRTTHHREDSVRPVRATTRSEQTTTKATTLCR